MIDEHKLEAEQTAPVHPVVPSHAAAPADEPTSGGRLLLGWGLIVLSAIMMFVGWYGVSGRQDVAGQLSYLLSGGVGGLLSGLIGIGLLISNDVRKDRDRLGRVEAAMLEIRDLLAVQTELLERLNREASGTSNASSRARNGR